MKKILITGQNSYIGNKFEEWVRQWPDEYQVSKISVRNDDWKNQNWSVYDVVLNVAGIAHQRITKENERDYYKVNRDLAIALAMKARNDKVSHFIQISTMSVYGVVEGTITENSNLAPQNAYGKSKLQADQKIYPMLNNNFLVTIIRPPMIYGPNCKGNYVALKKYSITMPIFPDFTNERSMLYVDNLSEFITKVMSENVGGVICPQNREYVSTNLLVKEIANIHNHNIHLVKFFNPIIRKLNSKIINKVFKTLIYDKKLSRFELDYNKVDFLESVRLSENA